MKLSKLHVVSCDVLVIGGGGAGLRAAIEAREKGADVLLVSKARAGYANNTIISKATFAVPDGWSDPRDNPEVYLKDAVIGGRFINDQHLVAAVAKEAGPQMPFLEKCGVKFLQSEGHKLAIHAPGHSYPRHVRARGREGRGLALPLKKCARDNGVRFADSVCITRLLTSKAGRIAAAAGITRDGKFLAFVSKCFVLATGGFAQIFLQTNNAPGICGDGLALAFEVGAPLKDMEFVQFYPTAAGKSGNRIILYEDLILRDKATLKNADGDDIVIKHGLDDVMKMTRDRLARVIMQEVLEGRGVNDGVIMDLSRASEPHLLKYRSLFKDPHKKECIVSPTTHFCSGGLIINANAETPIGGLFAAGETCAGAHGANRLAGNALSEVFAMGGIAGRMAALKAKALDHPQLPEKKLSAERNRLESLEFNGNASLRDLRRSLRQTMWYKAGITRHAKDLTYALGKIEEIRARIPALQLKNFRALIRTLELQNMLFSAEMVCRAALQRTESRGAHYRSDYPAENDKDWLKNIVIRRQETEISLQPVPVSMDLISP
ncbi:MAG: FAD-binding protein [Desulfobacterales bacterium]|nr:FAD-binding protein [Desulfobacterales bacterium]